jgi:hypothetical protein
VIVIEVPYFTVVGKGVVPTKAPAGALVDMSRMLAARAELALTEV